MIYTLHYYYGKGKEYRAISYKVSGEQLEKILKYWMEEEYKENRLYYYFFINRQTKDYIYDYFQEFAYNKYVDIIDSEENF